MKKYNYGFTGGFPLEQEVLDNMQNAYLDALNALVRFMRIPDTGSHILFGCKLVGADIQPGVMYIDGDFCHFAGVTGTGALTTKIAKQITTTNLPYQNGSNNPALITIIAVVDAGGVELQNFTSYSEQLVYDPNYNHTDNNLTNALLAHLMSIAFGAEVNVQADWNVTNALSDAFIKNKPVILEVVKPMTRFIGVPDVESGSGNQVPINFGSSVGTDQYSVLGCIVSQPASNWYWDNNIIWATKDHTTNGFTLLVREVGGSPQSVFFDFILIKRN